MPKTAHESPGVFCEASLALGTLLGGDVCRLNHGEIKHTLQRGKTVQTDAVTCCICTATDLTRAVESGTHVSKTATICTEKKN